MRSIRISLSAPKKAGQGFDVALAVADDVAAGMVGTFTAVKGAAATIATDLSLATPIADPERPGQPLTAERVLELMSRKEVPPEVGRYVYALLARGTLRAKWQALREQGDARTVIAIAGDKALALLHRLPWERMQDDDDDFLALQAGLPLLRWHEAASAPPAQDWPVRVLIANCAEPDAGQGAGNGSMQIAADAELRALERLFSSSELRYDVEYDVLEHPTPAQIVDACGEVRPHVLHFIGHGQGQGPPERHALSLWQPGSAAENREASYVDWKLADIRVQLRDRAPRLAFLNACRSSAGATEPATVANVSQAFLRAGTVATVGMQGDIAGDLAKVFAEAFYRALLGGGGGGAAGIDIDAAVAQARLVMARSRADASVMDDADWAFPVLTLRVLPHEVLPRSPKQRESALAERFVARLSQRRQAHAAIRCCAKAQPEWSQHMVVIQGDKRSGKSHLANWAAQACKRAGMTVLLRRFAGQEKVDWLDALRWIRDDGRRLSGGAAAPPLPVTWPLSVEAFRDFNWGLNRRQQGLTTFEPVPAGPVRDAGLGLSECPELPESFAQDTLPAFCDALAAAAPPAGLVLVLDQLEGLESTALQAVLMSGLFKPIADGHVPGVRLMLVMDDKQYGDCRGALDAMRAPVVPVPLFRRADFDRVARQLCYQFSDTLYEEPWVPPMLVSLLKSLGSPQGWGADVLEGIGAVLSRFQPKGG